MLKKLGSLVFSLLCTMILLGLLTSPGQGAVNETVYTAPDGMQIISYSGAWNDSRKLQDVYLELLRNAHGTELKLLKKIVIYPGHCPDGPDIAGRWQGDWKIVKDVPQLLPNCYIELYNGEANDTVEKLARTLSHEYGHHFTYYYYFKKDRKTWEQWRNSELGRAAGLTANPQVGVDGQVHMWQFPEIMADWYVQLFGSPTAKQSTDFKDIREQLSANDYGMTLIKGSPFNFMPQENYLLPLAANIAGLKDYWLKASGLPDRTGAVPPQISVHLKEVNRVHGFELRQYIISWDKLNSANEDELEYTLDVFSQTSAGAETFLPVKTVSGQEDLTAAYGAAFNEERVIYDTLPGLAFFVVNVKNNNGLITSSQVLAVDFTNPAEPQTVLIDDKSRLSGKWFPPRVKIGGKQVEFDVQPVIKDKRTLVPFRAIFEELGATVNWDGKSQTITAHRGETTLVLQIGSYKAEINGEVHTLDVPPEIKDDRTLVPLRFISEALGADVDWNENLQLATITI